MRDLPSQEELQQAWEDLCNIHAQYLEDHGVRIPGVNRYNETAKSIWLSVLHYCKNEEVHKDFISKVCQRDKSGLGQDQQVRHLKRDGWYLVEDARRGYHRLDPYQPSPEWETDKRRRDGRLDAQTFGELKTVYGRCCATCGAEAGKPNPRYGKDKVVFQQGHKDPAKPMTADNIIPQCQFCNRAYRGDYVFDDKGRVSHIADVRPVRKASKRVQRKVWEWLKTQFSLLF